MEHILGRIPLDLDFLEFTCTQELLFFNALSSQVTVCPAILDAINTQVWKQLVTIIQIKMH